MQIHNGRAFSMNVNARERWAELKLVIYSGNGNQAFFDLNLISMLNQTDCKWISNDVCTDKNRVERLLQDYVVQYWF